MEKVVQCIYISLHGSRPIGYSSADHFETGLTFSLIILSSERIYQFSNSVEGLGIFPTRQGSVASASPQEPLHSPESVLTSQEFVTAEFYIDESMPSSYTESGGTANSSSRHPPSLVKTHHVITAELQQQLEERDAIITTLQVSGRSCCPLVYLACLMVEPILQYYTTCMEVGGCKWLGEES